MLRFNKIADCVVQCDLPGTTYIAEGLAQWNKEDKNYTFSIRLKRNDMGDLMEFDDFTTVVESEPKTIRFDLANYITELYNKKLFIEKIATYDFRDKCFNKGIDIMEDERNG